jgi:D-glycero-D-manno-heptose 1,7-bisphosphate phosphatase
MKSAFFLDRDGVLVRDDGLVTRASELRILPGVVEALCRIDSAGYAAIVITNQTVVARGLLSEDALAALHRALSARLTELGAPAIAAFYSCPHHPHAQVEAYRIDCTCRKPRPGLLQRAAREHHLDLGTSYVVGDRPSDILAGRRAGCRTVLVRTGADTKPPIVGMTAEPQSPDHVFSDLQQAVFSLLGEPV